MARSDIRLFTASTMSRRKPLILWHEGEIEYEPTTVDFSKKEQKVPE